MPDFRPVGVFDSGVGGLSIVREMRRLMPMLDIVYVSDARFLPYGDKSEAFIPVSYTHLRAHETVLDIVCRLLLEKKKYHKSNVTTHTYKSNL